MAKQLNSYQVNLGFTADTSKAKKQLQDLQRQLTQIVNYSKFNNNSQMTENLQKASVAAAELKVHLSKAANVETGSLDFTKLNQSIKQSGKSLNEYADQLASIGPAGKQAFLSLTQSIVNAEVPIKRSSQMVTEMWTTLKNAARWQLSSSILHGFMGALSSAKGYAEDLNKSLNNIRIVTGNNVDQMAKFAEEANKAARTLSTTTTKYTDASLIYFQQGLDNEQVEERTAVTIKMANAAGVSAEKVSDQMTAVWNNFYDGSKSLEYYADVMTALGAATASSTDEISEGLNKFAAVAETVGLSYEYATAALATVTAETRESADIVGTAYKTLFARIQGLQQGETLDDGTDLNKYSKALANVGIQIKDETGNMKEMDSILNELGAKWGTLAKDQQLALAQTVAGVRQYTQLVALMDNWEVFQENLATAQGAEGALDEQAEIYAESWEAAQNRVRASIENIYQKIIDDEAFIDILGVIENLVNGIGNVIDTMGGLKGVLLTVGSIGTKVFKNQLSESISNLAYNLDPLREERVREQKKDFIQASKEKLMSMEDDTPRVNQTASHVYDLQLERQQKMIDKQSQMNEIEKETSQILMDQLELRGKIAIEKAKELDKAEIKKSDAKINLYNKAAKKASDKDQQYDIKQATEEINKLKKLAKTSIDLEKAYENLPKAGYLGRDSDEAKQLRQVIEDFSQIDRNIISDKESDEINSILEKLEDTADISLEGPQEEFAKLQGILKNIANSIEDVAATNLGADLGDVRQFTGAIQEAAVATEELAEANENLESSSDQVEEYVDTSQGKISNLADAFVSLARATLSVIGAWQAFKGIGETIRNDDLEPIEKFSSILSTLLIVIPDVIDSGKEVANTFKTLIIPAFSGLGVSAEAIIVPLVLLTGAIAAIGFAIKAYDAERKQANKVEKEAIKNAKDLEEQYKELKNSAEELKATISEYEDAQNALNELEKGTDEYAEALEHANTKAKELIETYKLWDSYEIKDGQIKIDPNALKDLQQEIDDKVDLAETRSYQGKIYQDQASIIKDTVNLRYDIGKNTISNEGIQEIAKIASNLQEQNAGIAPTAEQLRDYIQSEVKMYGGGVSEELLNNLDILGTIITNDTIQSFISLGESVNEAKEANEYYTKQILSSEIKDKYGKEINKASTDTEGNINSAKANNILNILSNEAQSLQKKQQENINEQYEKASEDIGAVKNTKDLKEFLDKEEYAETSKKIIGEDYKEAIKNDENLAFTYARVVKGLDVENLSYLKGNNKGSLQDTEGNVVVSEMSDEAMRRAIAQTIAMTSITDKILEEFEGSEEELQQRKEAVLELGSKGYISEQNFGADFSQVILESISSKSKDFDFSELYNELSPEEVKQLSSMTNEELSKALGITEQMAREAGYLGNDFFGKVQEGLKNWQYALDTTALEEKASNLQGIISSIEKDGTLDPETYQDLEKLGFDIDNYFTKMADGTYLLTGAAESFIHLLKQGIVDDYISKLKEFSDAREVAFNQVVDDENDFVKNNLLETEVISGAKGYSEAEDLGQARIEYINKVGNTEQFNFSDEQKELLNKEGGYTVQELQEIADMMRLVSERSNDMQMQILNTATSLDDLDRIASQLQENGFAPSDYDLGQALINLASQYDNCTKEIEEYQKALLSGDEATIEATKNALEGSVEVGELAKRYDLGAEELEDYAKRLQILHDKQKLTASEAARLAAANMRLDRGISDLNDNLKDYKKKLEENNEGSAEWSEALSDLKTNLADIANVADGSMLSDKFAKDTLASKDLEKALDGDVDAILRLRTAAADDIILQIKSNFEETSIEFQTIETQWAYLKANMAEAIKAPEADHTELMTSFNEMIKAGNMTREQIEAALSGLNVSADIETTYNRQVTTVPTTITEETIEPLSPVEVIDYYEDDNINKPVKRTLSRTRRYTNTYEGEPKEVEGYVPTYSIKGRPDSNGTSTVTKAFTAAPAPKVSHGSTTTGKAEKKKSGSKPAKPSAVKKTNKNDVVERYKEINDQIDDMADKMEDASTEADRLYGKDRIKAMNQVNNILQSEIDLLEQKKEEAQDYLKLDKQALQQAAKKAGLGDFTFDASGNITNYEEQMEAMYKRLAAAQEKAQPKNFSTKEAQDAYIEKNVTPLEEQIAELETAIGQYDETRELIEDLDNEARDKFNEWQDNNFEILNYKLELDLELNDSELKQLDYMLGKIEDDYYNLAEAAALMVGETAELQQNQIGGQMDVHFDNLDRLREQNNNLIDSYRNGEISQDAFMSGMKDLEDQVYDNLGSIQELDDSMVHYYGDTLEKAAEELEKYTELMEHQTEVLEHYTNVMDILGKSTDYKAMSVILEAQVKNAENALKVSQDNYEMLNKQALDRRAELEQALINGATEAEVEIIQQKWLDAQNAANEAQSKMMADTEAWAESLKAVLENKLAGFGQALENALTGDFGSFDEMNNAMERANSLQEEYLTTTNQIYETDKLINQAQKDIDKTTNTAAKKRLQNYIKETEQLQNQSQLSQYELEIQQAKYDLLLAEIALEEAQDAKSMVRLQRDSEGNFGYVYTADQNKVAEAEQQLADAQNRLYNIGLEGANSYTEKYQQTLGEMYDTLTDLQEQYLSGAFENEQEYNDAVTAAKEFYYDKLKQYSDLYAVALTTDSRVVADAWSTDFNDMIYSTDDWAAAVDDYVAQVQDAFADWEEQVADIRENTVGEDLDNLKELVDGVTDASDELAEAITEDNGLLDALEAEIEDVNNLTSAYANMRKQIQSAQEDYENLIKKINKAKEDPNSAEKMDEVDFGQKKTQSIPESEKQADATGAMGKDIDTSKIKKGSIVEVKPGAKWFYDSYGSTPTGPAKDGEIDAVNLNGTYQYNIKGLGWIRRSDIKAITKYDTGGYTGSWGSYGKLAMLHEKELILNKHDTENFLASMDILHNILQALDLNSLSNQLGGVLSTPQLGSMTEQTLEQNVTIEANFPGVSVASEIEEAFGNLVNLASQYANRK